MDDDILLTEDRRTPPDSASLWRHLAKNQMLIIELQRQQAQNQKEVAERLAAIADILSQAKGGWKVLIGVGSAVVAVSGFFAWIWLNMFGGKLPPH